MLLFRRLIVGKVGKRTVSEKKFITDLVFGKNDRW